MLKIQDVAGIYKRGTEVESKEKPCVLTHVAVSMSISSHLLPTSCSMFFTHSSASSRSDIGRLLHLSSLQRSLTTTMGYCTFYLVFLTIQPRAYPRTREPAPRLPLALPPPLATTMAPSNHPDVCDGCCFDALESSSPPPCGGSSFCYLHCVLRGGRIDPMPSTDARSKDAHFGVSRSPQNYRRQQAAATSRGSCPRQLDHVDDEDEKEEALSFCSQTSLLPFVSRPRNSKGYPFRIRNILVPDSTSAEKKQEDPTPHPSSASGGSSINNKPAQKTKRRKKKGNPIAQPFAHVVVDSANGVSRAPATSTRSEDPPSSSTSSFRKTVSNSNSRNRIHRKRTEFVEETDPPFSSSQRQRQRQTHQPQTSTPKWYETLETADTGSITRPNYSTVPSSSSSSSSLRQPPTTAALTGRRPLSFVPKTRPDRSVPENDGSNGAGGGNDCSDDDDGSDLEVPYTQNLGLPEDGHPHARLLPMSKAMGQEEDEGPREPLRPGDVIAYTHPLYVAGHRDGLRVALILGTRPTGRHGHNSDHVALTLDNGEILPGDTQVRRCKEYRQGRLRHHRGKVLCGDSQPRHVLPIRIYHSHTSRPPTRCCCCAQESFDPLTTLCCGTPNCPHNKSGIWKDSGRTAIGWEIL